MARRESEVDGILHEDARRAEGAAGPAPCSQVLASDADKRRVQFHANDPAEGKLGGEQNCAAHARTDVDKRCLSKRRRVSHFAPARDKRVKDGWRHAVVSGDMAIMDVAGAQMPAGNQAAGPHAVGLVPWMGEETVSLCQAGQVTTAGFAA